AEVDRMKDFISASRESDGMSVKRLQGALLRAEERIKKKLDSAKDPGITFEATGIDYLFIDFSDRPCGCPPRPASLLLAA
ncbi:MAG: hypothetical protein ACLP8X_00050, partial [Streptosporangiaceae bacterium]